MTRFLNQTQLLPQEEIDRWAIGIIGTGAIGSFVAMALTKMGFKNMVTWDPDKIEDHNIANQMFPVLDIGKRKANATKEMVEKFSGERIISLATKITGRKAFAYLHQAYPSKQIILILAVDSLDVRKQIIEDIGVTYNLSVIDARMGAKTYRVLGFDGSNPEEHDNYLKTLVPDSAAVQERCGQKSIIYTVLGVAAEVCGFVHYMVMRHTLEDHTAPKIPNPVIFDYGTGMRLQQRHIGETVVI